MLLFTVLKTALKKKNLIFLVSLSLCLISAFVYYFSFVKLKPNDLIITTSDGAALFSNENPNFKVDFGSKENPQGQVVRFEAKASPSNPFEVEDKKGLFTKFAGLFVPKKKVGIEMSLVGIDFSETGKAVDATLASNIQSVAEILGTDDIETSTNLIDMGREIGSYDTEEAISKPTIVNSNIANGIDLEYQILSGYGLKEEIVINDLEAYADSCGEDCSLPLNKFEFDLSVDDGVVLKKGWFTVEGQSTEIYYFVDGNGKYLAHFLPSYAIDHAGNKTYGVDLDIQEYSVGRFRAVVTVDSEWLLSEDRVYPIRIDPSIVHDDTSDFSGGIFVRSEAVTGPKLQSKQGVCSGGTLTTYDNYYVRSFTSSGTLTCSTSITADILVVGGGGSGGTVSAQSGGGGGGGGGVRYLTGLVLTDGSHTVTVGSGGSASNGGDSSFNSIVASGGGKGGANNANGNAGGSNYGNGGGAGGCYYNGGTLTTGGSGGTGGYSGGNGNTSTIHAGGGAGAGGAGIAASATLGGGGGGNGVAISITGSTVYYGGGGGAGIYASNGGGGNGGGGRGANDSSAAVAGTANTGGGGGGGYISGGSYPTGANGGSGIVVVRYSPSLSPYSQYISSTLDFSAPVEGATLSWISSGINTGNGETPYSTTGLVAQWNFNETSGTTAVSGGTCGTSCNGTLTNMTTSGQDAATMTGWTSNNRRWGAGAVMFDGSNDYVSCTDANCGGSGKLDAMSGSFSIETWVKPTTCSTSSVSPGIIDKFDTSTSKGYLIYNEYYGGANVWTFYDPVNNSYARSTTTCSTGLWTHIVAVYDSVGTSKKMYINGRLEATLTGQNPLGDSGSDFNIGRYRNSSYYYSGIIDSPRIYSRALSADEILSNYQSGNIEFQYRVSTDGNTWSDWISDGVSTSDASWKTYDDQYLYNPSSTGLVTYWAMDESSTGTAYDVSTIHHASASGTTVVNGKYGNARYFNGSSDYLRASPSIDNPLKTGSFTLSGWFNANSFTNYMTILQRGIVSSGASYYGMGLYATSSAIYFVRNVGAAQSQISYSYTFATSTWYHAAATYNDSTGAVALYLNGALVASGTLSTNDVSYHASYDVGYTIGAMRRNISDSYGNQTLDEILIFNTVLTASDINNLYITGLGSLGVYQQKAVGSYQEGITDTYLYSSSESGQTSYWPMENPSGTTVSDIVGSNSGTASGTTVVSGRYGNSRSFNGSSDYVTIPNTIDTPIKTGSFTLSSWFKASSFSTNMTIFQRGIVSSGGLYYGMGLYASSTAITFARNVASSSAQISYTYNFLTNVWYHVAATYNDSTGAVAIYLNGIPVSTGTLSTNDVAYHGSYDQGYTVGAMLRNISNSYSNGIIDELRIFNTVRSASDIEDEYDRGMEISHIEGGIRTEGVSSSRITNTLGNGLVSYWKLDESSGTSLSDSVGSNTGTATGTSVVTGKYNNGRNFTSGNYISLGTNSSLRPSYITFGGWFKTSVVASGYQMIMIQDNTYSTLKGYGFFLYDSTLVYRVGDGTNYHDVSVSYSAYSGAWTHIMATYDGTTQRLYVNGVQVSSAAWSGTIQYNSTPTELGRFNYAGGYYYTGIIDEVKLFNVAKTATEILEEYNATSTYYTNYVLDSTDLSSDNTISVDIAGDKVGTYSSLIWGESAYANYQTDSNTVGLWHLDEISGSGAYLMDSSGRGNNGTPTTASYTSSGKISGGRAFTATNNYVNVGSSSTFGGLTSFTLEAWIYPTTVSGEHRIFDRGSSGSPNTILLYQSGANLSLLVNNADSVTASNVLSANQWYHVVAVYVGNTSKELYVNGVKMGSGTATQASPTAGSIATWIGCVSWTTCSSYAFVGTIDEVRLSNTARTPDQIRQAYEIGLRTHNVTVDFGATLNSSNLIANSSDTSFTIDATTQGLAEMGSNLYVEDKIIVREVSSGTEYIAQGSVSSITELTGATEVSSWDSESTFPSGGFTTKASVFKWQREYIPVKNRTIGTQVDATSLLTLRLTSAFGGRNIWIDNLRTSDGHLANSSGEELIFPYEAQYFQYKALIMSQDTAVTPYISQVQLDYEGSGPTLEQLMRHGQWFDSGGAKKGYWWVGTH